MLDTTEQKIMDNLDEIARLFCKPGKIDFQAIYNEMSLNGTEFGLGLMATIEPVEGVIANILACKK